MNPANNDITLNGTNNFESLTILDINGRELKQLELKASMSNYKLNINKLSQGLYFLEIKSGLQKETKKFIKK